MKYVLAFIGIAVAMDINGPSGNVQMAKDALGELKESLDVASEKRKNARKDRNEW